MSLNRVDKAL